MPAGPFRISARAWKELSRAWPASFIQLESAVGRCGRSLSEKRVHHARLAARHCLPVLEVLRVMVPEEEHWKAAHDGVRDLLHALGPLRDAQLRLIRLEKMKGYDPVVKRLLKRAAAEVDIRDRMAAEVLQLYQDVPVDELEKALKAGVKDGAKDLLHAITDRCERRRARLTARWGAIDLRKPATLHRARIALKRYRYLLIALGPILSGELIDQQDRLALAQKIIGRYHDDQLFLTWLRRQGPGAKKVIARVRENGLAHRARLKEFLQRDLG